MMSIQQDFPAIRRFEKLGDTEWEAPKNWEELSDTLAKDKENYPKFQHGEENNPLIQGERLFSEEEFTIKFKEYKYKKHVQEMAASLFSLRCSLEEEEWQAFKDHVKKKLSKILEEELPTDKQATHISLCQQDYATIFKEVESIHDHHLITLEEKKQELGQLDPLLVREEDIASAALNRLYVEYRVQCTTCHEQILALKNEKKPLMNELEANKQALDKELAALKRLGDSSDDPDIQEVIEKKQKKCALLEKNCQDLKDSLRQNILKTAELQVEHHLRQALANTFANRTYVCRSAVYHVFNGQSGSPDLPISQQTLLGSALQQVGFKLLHSKELTHRGYSPEEVAYYTAKYGQRLFNLIFSGRNAELNEGIIKRLAKGKKGKDLPEFTYLKSEQLKHNAYSTFKKKELTLLNDQAKIIQCLKSHTAILDAEKPSKILELIPKLCTLSSEEEKKLYLSISAKLIGLVCASRLEQKGYLWGQNILIPLRNTTKEEQLEGEASVISSPFHLQPPESLQGTRGGSAIDEYHQIGEHATNLVMSTKGGKARVSNMTQKPYSQSAVVAGASEATFQLLGVEGMLASIQKGYNGLGCREHSLTESYIALYPDLQTRPGLINVQANANGIHLKQRASLVIQSNPTIQYHAAPPSRLTATELNRRLKDLLPLKCPHCIKDLMMQGHKFLNEVEGETSLHGAFYLATAYELYVSLNVQEYRFTCKAFDEYLGMLEKSLGEGESLLHYFAAKGNSSIFIYLFSERQNVESYLDVLAGRVIKETPLHISIKSGSIPITQFLLEKGADIKKGRYGEEANTVLHVAAEYGREEIIDLLLQHKDIQEILDLPQGRYRYTALHLAAAKGYYSILIKLIEHGACTEQQDLLYHTPLEILLAYESPDFVAQDKCACLLLSKKDSSFFQLDNPSLKRCFINALQHGLLDTAQKLAKNGLSQLEEHERSFIEIAAEGAFQRTHIMSLQEMPKEKRTAYIDLIYWLLTEKKIDPNEKFRSRNDFLVHQVCYSGCSRLLFLLIDLKVDLKKLDGSHNTALHHACRSQRDCVNIVRILLGHAPTLMEAKNSDGQLPLHLAALTGNEKSVQLLLSQTIAQIQLAQQDRERNTPLHLAVIGESRSSAKTEEHYCKIIQALVEKGSNLNILNKEKKTALELALKSGNEAIMQALSQAALNPLQLTNSLRSLYLYQKTLSIFRIKAEQEWEFKVPLEEIYVRLGIIERKERIARDQALDKHSDQIQDDRLPTSETIYEPKLNIEIEKLFEHESLENKEAKRIYIQGAAGIGKSTLCHYIAYRWAKEELWQKAFSYLFWIPLRNLTLKKYPPDKEYTPADLIAKEYEDIIVDPHIIDACINDATFREKTLLVLDGYDELSADAQGNTSLATAFNKLKKLFPHILITSRPGSCSFNRSCELELLGFDKKGVDRYIDRFFKQVQAEEKKQKLHHLLQTSPQVASLAQIPINLTLLCCLFNEDPEAFNSTQPITMTAIYEQIVNWMYKWFLLRKIGQVHSPQTMEKILTEKNLRDNPEVAKIAIAFEKMADWAMEKNTLYLGKQEIDKFRGDAITSNELTDCGLLRIPEEKGYFIHLTFQEFLTASKIANQYLHPQGENRKACQDFVHNYKFEPRYNLVLRMIAGYLSLSITNNRLYSDLKPNPLQSFFDDLFAEPHDLAVKSELNLIAECFEECQNPTLVRQYEGFIELVKDYVIHLSLSGLNFEMLLRNKSLFNHHKITVTIEKLLSDPSTIQNMLVNLKNLIRTRQKLSLKMLKVILKILKDPEENLEDRGYAAKTLEAVIEQGGELLKKTLDDFVQILKEGDFIATPTAVKALEAIARQGGELPKEALEALIQILEKGDPHVIPYDARARDAAAWQGGELPKEALDALIQIFEGDFFIATRTAAKVLKAIAKQGGELSKEALDALIQILEKGSFRVRSSVAWHLEAIAKQGGELPKEALDALIQILKKGDSAVIPSAAKVLEAVARQGGELPKEALDALIQILKKGDSAVIPSAAKVLKAVARQGGELPKEALDALIQILEKGDFNARPSAVRVLGAAARQGDGLPKNIIDDLLQILEKSDSSAIPSAIKVLEAVVRQGGALSKEALDAFIQILEKSDFGVIAIPYAVEALAVVIEQKGERSKEALDALIQILEKGNSIAIRAAAAVLEAVARQGDELPKKALDALIQILKEDNFTTRPPANVALRTVMQQRGGVSEKTIDDLIHLMVESSFAFRYPTAKISAARVLGAAARQGDELPKNVIDDLLQILEKSYSSAIPSATKVLQAVVRQGGALSKEALDALIQILERGNSSAIHSVTKVLETVVRQRSALSEEALDALIQILKKSNSASISAAVKALKTIASQGCELPKNVIEDLLQILQEGDSDTIPSAAKVLKAVARQGNWLPKNAMDDLTQILKEDDSIAISAAAKVLEAVARQGGELPKETLDALIQILKEDDSIAISAAAKVLEAVARQGSELPKNVIDDLLQILQEGDSIAVRAAAKILEAVAQEGGKLPKEALDAFIQILNEGEPDAKLSTARALKKVDKNALLKMGIEAFPLIAEICFFIESSFSLKGEQFQISEKRITYYSEHTLKLNYDELKEKLPAQLAVWRKRVDNLSQNGSSQGHINQT
ncbi:hypothetical protein NEOC65_002353 [Neochlamydia sp. AcF65]|uniref:ankyrin repeat domain-containing protein n=1 Tax=Neochlamydia sp. AcF65 TaxID=2795735 RepID=UPI001BCA426F|nr:ankyrin repeat domain-containing protein [Neochlamydia sp. AcF65]MBS4167247.1 hypothetical protein [Neochlamydia sp. AcF65]